MNKLLLVVGLQFLLVELTMGLGPKTQTNSWKLSNLDKKDITAKDKPDCDISKAEVVYFNFTGTARKGGDYIGVYALTGAPTFHNLTKGNGGRVQLNCYFSTKDQTGKCADRLGKDKWTPWQGFSHRGMVHRKEEFTFSLVFTRGPTTYSIFDKDNLRMKLYTPRKANQDFPQYITIEGGYEDEKDSKLETQYNWTC